MRRLSNGQGSTGYYCDWDEQAGYHQYSWLAGPGWQKHDVGKVVVEETQVNTQRDGSWWTSGYQGKCFVAMRLFQ